MSTITSRSYKESFNQQNTTSYGYFSTTTSKASYSPNEQAADCSIHLVEPVDARRPDRRLALITPNRSRGPPRSPPHLLVARDGSSSSGLGRSGLGLRSRRSLVARVGGCAGGRGSSSARVGLVASRSALASGVALGWCSER